MSTPVKVITKTYNDVVSGRGGAANHHPGNVFFRSCVAKRKKEYALSLSLKEKRAMVAAIIEEVRKSGGRFLTYHNCVPVEMTHAQATRKVMQALREGAEKTRSIAAKEGQIQNYIPKLKQTRKRKRFNQLTDSKVYPPHSGLRLPPCSSSSPRTCLFVTELPSSKKLMTKVVSVDEESSNDVQAITNNTKAGFIPEETIKEISTEELELKVLVEEARKSLKAKAVNLMIMKKSLEAREKDLEKREYAIKAERTACKIDERRCFYEGGAV